MSSCTCFHCAVCLDDRFQLLVTPAGIPGRAPVARGIDAGKVGLEPIELICERGELFEHGSEGTGHEVPVTAPFCPASRRIPARLSPGGAQDHRPEGRRHRRVRAGNLLARDGSMRVPNIDLDPGSTAGAARAVTHRAIAHSGSPTISLTRLAWFDANGDGRIDPRGQAPVATRRCWSRPTRSTFRRTRAPPALSSTAARPSRASRPAPPRHCRQTRLGPNGLSRRTSATGRRRTRPRSPPRHRAGWPMPSPPQPVRRRRRSPSPERRAGQGSDRVRLAAVDEALDTPGSDRRLLGELVEHLVELVAAEPVRHRARHRRERVVLGGSGG